ncbi:MAG: hypothetical protein PHC34_12440 [Candidatus Gastranaerophilales bacterium]|nr:hypothetical protein [Candidatus Gastranaerophilales bacterium]
MINIGMSNYTANNSNNMTYRKQYFVANSLSFKSGQDTIQESSNKPINPFVLQFVENIKQKRLMSEGSKVNTADLPKQDKNIHEKYKNDQNFIELLQNKYFNGENGSKELLGIINNLEKSKIAVDERTQRLEKHYNDAKKKGILVDYINFPVEITIDDCLRYLNKFLKSDEYDENMKNKVIEQSSNIQLFNLTLRNFEDNPDKLKKDLADFDNITPLYKQYGS